jgi:hypothetical protein
MHIKDWLATQANNLPVDGTDTDLVLDLDFTQGPASINAKLVTAEGFTHTATGETWDATLGWNPNGTAKYVNTNWTPSGTSPSNVNSRAGIGNNYTIYFEVQRSAIGATFLDNPTSFIDSGAGPSGTQPGTNPYGATGNGSIFQTGKAGGNFDNIACYYQVAASLGYFMLSSRNNATTASFSTKFHADKLSNENDFVPITIVGEGLTEYWYIDGMPRRIFLRTILPQTDDIFQAMRFADDGGASPRGLRGYIRRFQLLRRAVAGKVHHGPRVAFIGDSYVQRGASQATPGAQTVAAINAVQNAQDDTYLTISNDSTKSVVLNTQYTPLFYALQKQAAKLGARPAFYAAGDSGHGWGSGGGQIRQAFFDAVGAYDPEIIVCLGSVNDVVANPADLIGDTKSRLTYMAALCRNLRKILFVQTFPGWKCGNTNWNTPTAIAIYKAQIAAQEGLNGYAVTTKDGRTVTVQFVPTYEALGGDNYNADINLGGNQYLAAWKTFSGSSIEDGDVHPGQYGMNRMAEIIWPALQPYLLNKAMYYP